MNLSKFSSKSTHFIIVIRITCSILLSIFLCLDLALSAVVKAPTIPNYVSQRMLITELGQDYIEGADKAPENKIKQYGLYPDTELKTWVQNQLNIVLSAIPNCQPNDIKIHIYDTELFVFESYVDSIGLSRGAIQLIKSKTNQPFQFIKTEQAFRAVLAHEMAHILNHDIYNILKKQKDSEDEAKSSWLHVRIFEAYKEFRKSHEIEHASDALAVSLSAKIGDPAEAISEALLAFSKADKLSERFTADVFKDHPDNFKRIKHVEQLALAVDSQDSVTQVIDPQFQSDIKAWLDKQSPRYHLEKYFDDLSVGSGNDIDYERYFEFRSIFESKIKSLSLDELFKFIHFMYARQLYVNSAGKDFEEFKESKSKNIAKAKTISNGEAIVPTAVLADLLNLYFNVHKMPELNHLDLTSMMSFYNQLNPFKETHLDDIESDFARVWKNTRQNIYVDLFKNELLSKLNASKLDIVREELFRNTNINVYYYYVRRAAKEGLLKSYQEYLDFRTQYYDSFKMLKLMKNFYIRINVDAELEDEMLTQFIADDAQRAQLMFDNYSQAARITNVSEGTDELENPDLSWADMYANIFFSNRKLKDGTYLPEFLRIMKSYLESRPKRKFAQSEEDKASEEYLEEQHGMNKGFDVDEIFNNPTSSITNHYNSLLPKISLNKLGLEELLQLRKDYAALVKESKSTKFVAAHDNFLQLIDDEINIRQPSPLEPTLDKELQKRYKKSGFGLGLLAPKELRKLALHYCKDWACAQLIFKDMQPYSRSRNPNGTTIYGPKGNTRDGLYFSHSSYMYPMPENHQAVIWNDLVVLRRELAKHFKTPLESITPLPRPELSIWQLDTEYNQSMSKQDLSAEILDQMKRTLSARIHARMSFQELAGLDEFIEKRFSKNDFTHLKSLYLNPDARCDYLYSRKLHETLYIISHRLYLKKLQVSQPKDLRQTLELLSHSYTIPSSKDYYLMPERSRLLREIRRLVQKSAVNKETLHDFIWAIDFPETREWAKDKRRFSAWGKTEFEWSPKRIDADVFRTLNELIAKAEKSGIDFHKTFAQTPREILKITSQFAIGMEIGTFDEEIGTSYDHLIAFHEKVSDWIEPVLKRMSFAQAFDYLQNVYRKPSSFKDKWLLWILKHKSESTDQAWMVHEHLSSLTAQVAFVRVYKERFYKKFKKVTFEEYFQLLSRALTGYSEDADDFNLELLNKARTPVQLKRAQSRVLSPEKVEEMTDNMLNLGAQDLVIKSALEGVVDSLWPLDKAELLIWLMDEKSEPKIFSRPDKKTYFGKTTKFLLRSRFESMGDTARRRLLHRILSNVSNKGVLSSKVAEQTLLDKLVYDKIKDKKDMGSDLLRLIVRVISESAPADRKAQLYVNLFSALVDEKELAPQKLATLLAESFGTVGLKLLQTLYMFQAQIPKEWTNAFGYATDRTTPIEMDTAIEILKDELETLGHNYDDVIYEVDGVLGAASTSTGLSVQIRSKSKPSLGILSRLPEKLQYKIIMLLTRYYPNLVQKHVINMIDSHFKSNRLQSKLESFLLEPATAQSILRTMKDYYTETIMTLLRDGRNPKEIKEILGSKEVSAKILEMTQHLFAAEVKNGWVNQLLNGVRYGGLPEELTNLADDLPGAIQRMVKYWGSMSDQKVNSVRELVMEGATSRLMENLSAEFNFESVEEYTRWVAKVQSPYRLKKLLQDFEILYKVAEAIEAEYDRFGIKNAKSIVSRVARGVLAESNYLYAIDNQTLASRVNRSRSLYTRAIDFLMARKRALIPEIRVDLSTPNLMIEQMAQGFKFSDLQELANNQNPDRQLGLDIEKAYSDVLNVVLYQLFTAGRFGHGDMHEGNFFVSKEGEMILIDWGVVASLTSDQAKNLMRLFVYFDSGEFEKLTKTMIDMAINKQVQSTDKLVQRIKEMHNTSKHNSGFGLLNMLSIVEEETQGHITDDVFKALRSVGMLVQLRPNGSDIVKKHLKRLYVIDAIARPLRLIRTANPPQPRFDKLPKRGKCQELLSRLMAQ